MLVPLAPERHMVNQVLSQTNFVPQITVWRDLNVSLIKALRDAVRPEFERTTGAHLGYMPFFIKAVAKALRAAPHLNASLMPNGLWLHDRIGLGIPTNTPRGTQVPAISDPDQKSVREIAVELHEKTERCRNDQMGMQDFAPTTFSVSNSGSLGNSLDKTIVIPPHVGAMTIGAIEKRPVVVNDRVEIRLMLTASLSFDHRAMDAEPVKKFWDTLQAAVEKCQLN